MKTGFLIDMDGVIYRGGQLIEGAPAKQQSANPQTSEFSASGLGKI